MWNTSRGKLQATFDYSRKKVLSCSILNQGKVLILKFKKEGKVVLVDLESGYEKTLSEGDEDTKM